jgi:outer membrane lipoprotein LolB
MLNKLFILLFVLFITGCSTFYRISDKTHNQYVRPDAIDNNFDITGRFFIQNTTNIQYGNFAWNKTGTHEILTFNTPLGQTVAKITIESSDAILDTGQKVYTGSNLDALMLNNLGFSIPIEYLHYWIQGVTFPNINVDNQNEFGFTQLGWTIEYLEWYDHNHPKVLVQW